MKPPETKRNRLSAKKNQYVYSLEVTSLRGDTGSFFHTNAGDMSNVSCIVAGVRVFVGKIV